MTTQGEGVERCPSCGKPAGQPGDRLLGEPNPDNWDDPTGPTDMGPCPWPGHTTEQPAGDEPQSWEAGYEKGWADGRRRAQNEYRAAADWREMYEAQRQTLIEARSRITSLEAERDEWRNLEAQSQAEWRRLGLRVEQLEKYWAASIDAKEHMREHIKQLEKALREIAELTGHAEYNRAAVSMGRIARRALSPDPTTSEEPDAPS